MEEENDNAAPYAQASLADELSNDRLRDIINALDDEHYAIVCELCQHLQAQDQAELLNQLSMPQRQKLVAALGDTLAQDVLAWLDEDAAEDVIAALGHDKTVIALSNMERDDALHLLKDLPEEEQQVLLDSMQEDTRQDLEQSFAYPQESGGRLMQKRFVSVPEYWTIGNVIDYVRTKESLPEHFYVIYVVNHRFHPCGLLPLSRLLRFGRDVKVEEVMTTHLHTQTINTDQEEVAHIFRKYGLVEAPVVSVEGRLIGTITVDDVVFVMQKEGEEDFLRSAGLNSQDVYYSLKDSVQTRFPWLFINLLTAIAASMVIGMFEGVLEKMVALAVLMPIIASMGGNAGIQSATIAVRALATRKLAMGNMGYMVRKEMMLGALNGCGLAIITGLGVLAIYQDAHIAGIFAAATIITMIIAGLTGAALPFLFQKLGVDPAISSGVFLTMFTDMFGFFTFLGLAAWLLQ